MKIKKIFKLSKRELIIRQIFHIHNHENLHDKTVWNPYNLTIYDKDLRLFVSANELNNILKNTNYGIHKSASTADCTEPLFDKHNKIYDVLIYTDKLNSQICQVERDNRKDYLESYFPF